MRGRAAHAEDAAILEPGTVVLSLVERGWQGARECSLSLEAGGARVIHVVKGRVSRSVKSLIALRPHERMIGLPRKVYWPALWLALPVVGIAGRVSAVMVDNERSERRMKPWGRLFGWPLVLVRLGDQGYELWREHQLLVRSPKDRARTGSGARLT